MISSPRSVLVLAVLAALATGCAASADPVGGEDSSADELRRARFTSLAAPSDPDLAAFYGAANGLENEYLGVYRFNKPGAEATDPGAREKRIKEVMHRYMCGFFDESIDIGRNTGAGRVQATLRDVAVEDYGGDPSPAAIGRLSSTLSRVFANPKMDVLSGGASGNNTMGEVMGVYDTENHEVLFFGFTNCGSDD
ncbi:MAG: hypothetical protein IPG50_17840 [Myxococcales bacterium]|nr:hypothetical protein [Myxococcales bacterium]